MPPKGNGLMVDEVGEKHDRPRFKFSRYQVPCELVEVRASLLDTIIIFKKIKGIMMYQSLL